MMQSVRTTSKRAAQVVVLAFAALALPGCLAIKSQETSQRAPGVVSLDLVVCATDRDRQIDPNGSDPPPPVSYPDCDPDGTDGAGSQNTAEQAMSGDMEDEETLAQILLAFRVPVGSEGPQSFRSQATDLTFDRSATYEAELNEPRTEDDETGWPPPAGYKWVGYISTPREFDLVNDVATRVVAGKAEFTLPPQADGGPFQSQFLWRAVVGWRYLSGGIGQAGLPVDCDGGDVITLCIDSPTTDPDRVSVDLSATVSDFGVLGAPKVTVGQGDTAAASFPIKYRDARGLGAQQFALTATTNVPGTGPFVATPTVTVEPNGTGNAEVTVRVPPGTPLGSYELRLNAATGTPAVTRSNTATIEVVDKIAPTIQVMSPPQNATLRLGQKVKADYSCADELNGSGLLSCAGPVASGALLKTGSPGAKTFTVNATDKAGNKTTVTRTYNVKASAVGSTVAWSTRFWPTYTIFTQMVIKRVPAGATIRLTCKGNGCPFKKKKLKQKKAGNRKVTKLFKRSRLGVKSTIIVRVTKPKFIGSYDRFTVRPNNKPTWKVLCLPIGSSKPIKRC